MPKVTDVLQWIGHDCGREALAYLCDQRGLPRRQGKDAMRTQLARSYRGNLAVLIDDLRRKDLVTLLGSPQGVFVADHWFRLPNAGAFTLDDLRATAKAALVSGKTAEFVLGDGEDDGDDDDDEQDDDEGGDDDDDLDALSEDDEEDEDTLALKERLQAYSGRRSIEIRSLLRKAGLGEFERLRTERFQELVAMVEKAGYRVCDTDGVPYEDDDESPGIDARVLVLLPADDDDDIEPAKVVADGDDDDDDDEHVADPEPQTTGPTEAADLESLAAGGSCRLKRVLSVLGFGDLKRLKTARFSALLEQLADRGYDAFAADGTHCTPGMPSPGIDARVRLKRRFAPTPISFVGTSQPLPAPLLRAVSDYEVAVARLKVLTGIPWVARRACGDWPVQFMQLALDALALDEGQRHIVSLVGEKVVTGVHDIEQPLALLRESQERGRLAALVDGFELLNEAAGADTAVIATKMRARLGLTTAPPADARPNVVPFPTEDVPMGRAAAPATGAAADAVNVRDLGALKGIFD